MAEKDYFSFKHESSEDDFGVGGSKRSARNRVRSAGTGTTSFKSFSPSRPVGQGPRSPGYSMANQLRSPPPVTGHSPLNTLKLNTSGLKHAVNTMSPASNSSSAKSSRKPSISGPSGAIKAAATSPGNRFRSNSLSSARSVAVTTDSAAATPTLVLPPNLASLNSQSTSNVGSPQFPSGVQSASGNSQQHLDQMSSSSSSRSGNNSSTTTLRSFKPIQKQYVLNEQLYLDKMKNSRLDEYYTRGIAASINDEEEETDLDVEDTDNDEAAFGTNFFTTTEKGSTLAMEDELVTISARFLLGRMDWLRQADGENSTVRELLGPLQRVSSSGTSLLTPQSTISPPNEKECQESINRLSHTYYASERLEWQTMLTNVLRGDIVKIEKSKIAHQAIRTSSDLQYADDLWLELKAWMNCRPVEDERKSLEYLRTSTETLVRDIMELKFKEGITVKEAAAIVEPLVNKFHRVTSYWRSLPQMYHQYPVTGSSEFEDRIATMNTLLTLKEAFDSEIECLKSWIGSEELDVQFTSTDHDIEGVYKNESTFAEQILKERDIESIFQKKIFFRHAPWILKAKVAVFTLHQTMHDMNMPLLDKELEILLMFPLKLVKEIIRIRLEYAEKLKNPTMMMIDQMIDDFSSYIRLSVQIKRTTVLYCSDWSFGIEINPRFDFMVNEAIRYLFKLLHLKLLDSAKKSFKTFREPEELLKYWDQLKNVCCHIEGAGQVVAEGFTQLTLRLLNRLHSYVLREQNNPPNFRTQSEVEKWLVQTMENIGSFKRKINRFSNVLSKALQNSVNYKISDHQKLLERLKESGHFLVYTGGELEKNGIYLFCSDNLLGCSDLDILKILHNSEIGSDLIPSVEIKNSLSVYNALEMGWDQDAMIYQEYDSDGIAYYYVQPENNVKITNSKVRRGTNFMNSNAIDDYKTDEDEFLELELKVKSLGYIIAISPSEPLLWGGEMLNLSENTKLTMNDLDIKIMPDSLVLLNQGSTYAMDYQCDRFQHFVGDSVSFNERRCSINSVENTLQRINRAYFRVTFSVLANAPKVVSTVQRISHGNETINNLFIFCRDFAKNFLRLNVATYEKKSIIIMHLLKLSLAWISFLVDDCDPTDSRTFRWCVPAMEFAMQMTTGWNIMSLDEKQFSLLKQKISGCMSLLISHFDIMGARTQDTDKTVNVLVRNNIEVCEDDDDAILAVNSEIRVRAIQDLEQQTKSNPRQAGKVLDATDKENQYLLSLASSFSNVSIRWQKRTFIGGGTFGTVFSAINLDTGEILAVKEIKIQDRKSMKQVFPSIKEEMSVLEVLNHPNVVQYYGVEVHRDKVNLFMEYCEGGSLAQLLEHGRIEDEMVTQVYTLQMVEGLAYLHQSGVVHRDIKPENILLDFNGIIKYVDFGAARLIAANGTKGATSTDKRGVNSMMGTPMYMSPESITNSRRGKLGSDDIWSLGCVVLEMVSGRRPWSNLDNEWAIMYHVAAGHVPQMPNKDEISKLGLKFLGRCLIQDPNRRSTAMELLMDPWMTEIRQLAFGDGTSDAEAPAPDV